MENIKCDLCKNEFRRKRSQILLAKKHYCSTKCHNLDKRKGKIIVCFVCKRKVYKKNKDIDNSKNKKYFCSVKCSNQWLGSKNQGKNHPNWINGKSVYKNILKRTDISRFCRMCGEKDTRILVVHHIDQNRENNALTNLAWLCHNCHFLVHHYIKDLDKFNNLLKKYDN